MMPCKSPGDYLIREVLTGFVHFGGSDDFLNNYSNGWLVDSLGIQEGVS